MNIFKEITALLGWLSGSLAGIAAIFYSCGYLIKRAHLNLLGISALFSFSEEQYVQEGAKFVTEMVDLVARTALPLLMVAIVAAAGIFILRRTRLRPYLDQVQSWFAEQADRRHWAWRFASFGALVYLLALFIDRELRHFAAPLAVCDLLFAPSAAASADAASIRELLVAGDRTNLNNLYFNLTLGVLKAGALLLLGLRTVEPWRFRMLLIAPFALAFLLSALLLPMAYGVLMRPARFPLISVSSENKTLGAVRGELYLLDKTHDEFVLWDASARRVLWLPHSEIKSAEIGRTRFLFGPDRNGAEVMP